MPRVKRAVHAAKKRRKIIEAASGYFGGRKNHVREARLTLMKAMTYATRDRRVKKRDFRRLWVVRINAAARLNGLSYNQLIHGLSEAGVELDRKILSELAVNDAAAFTHIAKLASEKLAKSA
jgi:large subunit ribosomal protein L20